ARSEVPSDLRDVDELDREAAGLELAAELVGVALGALQPERPAVEVIGLPEARDRQEDEVGAFDQGFRLAQIHLSSRGWDDLRDLLMSSAAQRSPQAGKQVGAARGEASVRLAETVEQRALLEADPDDESDSGQDGEHDQRRPVPERQPDAQDGQDQTGVRGVSNPSV